MDDRPHISHCAGTRRPLAGAALAAHFVDHCERRDHERSAEAKARGMAAGATTSRTGG
jgi:hypothetical protein